MSGSDDKTLDDGTVYTDATTETFDVTYGGRPYLTIKNYFADGDLVFSEYTSYENGTPAVMADSDGNVVPVKVDEDGNVVPNNSKQWNAQKQSGSTYPVSMIGGKTTKVTLEDTNDDAKLVNGDPKPAVIGDEITFVTGDGVDIGTDEDPITTAPYTDGATVEINFETLEDHSVRANTIWRISLTALAWASSI